MILKIERIRDSHKVRLRLSGEFRSHHLDQVKAEISRQELPYWIWRRSILWTSKPFGSSMPARTKVSRCCTARLISRSGCRGSGKKRKRERIGDDDIAERGKE